MNGKCECSMSISMLGDGCRYCQPQEYIDRLHESIEEDRAEVEELESLKQELQALREQKPVAEVKFAMQFEITPDINECILQNVHVGTKLYAAPMPEREGWKLVPIEPTEEMVKSARNAHEGSAYLPYSLYASMLEASPKEPS